MAICNCDQLDLFSTAVRRIGLPAGHVPVAPDGFAVERIVLSRGSLDTAERESFVRGICGAYPDVPVVKMLDVAHSRIELEETDPVKLYERGKKTLVLGEIKVGSAVRMNRSPNSIFPYRQSFSVYGSCPYDCKYCYLAGSPGVWFTPTVII